jgi:hypothetical protein
MQVMKLSRVIALAAVITTVGARFGFAQTATQTVTFQVDAINQISVSGTPTLVINTATAGSAPTDATYSTSSWAVTTNQSTAKITGSIPTAMPTGLTLSANLTAPAGASSAGATSLGTSAVDLVTGITKVAAGSLNLTYTLSATTAAGVVTSQTRLVTYTITGGS